MQEYQGGSEVVLVRGDRIVTRFRVDMPAEMLIEQITGGRWQFKRFCPGEPLQAELRGRQVWVWPAGQTVPLESAPARQTRKLLIRPGRAACSLTDRQRQVLNGLASGQTVAEIGYRLGIRARSVRHHVDALKQKLGAVSLSELVARALSSGLPLNTPPQGGTGAERRSDSRKKR